MHFVSQLYHLSNQIFSSKSRFPVSYHKEVIVLRFGGKILTKAPYRKTTKTIEKDIIYRYTVCWMPSKNRIPLHNKTPFQSPDRDVGNLALYSTAYCDVNGVVRCAAADTTH